MCGIWRALFLVLSSRWSNLESFFLKEKNLIGSASNSSKGHELILQKCYIFRWRQCTFASLLDETLWHFCMHHHLNFHVSHLFSGRGCCPRSCYFPTQIKTCGFLQVASPFCCLGASIVFLSSWAYLSAFLRPFWANMDGCSIFAKPPSVRKRGWRIKISKSSSSWIPSISIWSHRS